MARSPSRRKRDRSSSRSRSRSTSKSSSTTSSSSSSSSPSSRSSSSSSSDSSRSSSSSSTSSRSSRSDASRGSRRGRSSSPVCKIHVSRLTRNVNKNHIQEIFKSYGPIKSVDLPMDRHHPQLGKGTAIVEFDRVEDAEKAIRYMDGGQIDGQEIAVSKLNTNKMMARHRAGGSNRNGSWRR